MTYVAIWLYVCGVVMCAGMNMTIEGGDRLPHWIGALFWPFIVPFVMVRRIVKKLAA